MSKKSTTDSQLASPRWPSQGSVSGAIVRWMNALGCPKDRAAVQDVAAAVAQVDHCAQLALIGQVHQVGGHKGQGVIAAADERVVVELAVAVDIDRIAFAQDYFVAVEHDDDVARRGAGRVARDDVVAQGVSGDGVRRVTPVVRRGEVPV